MAFRKKGKWKDRQHKPSERRVNGRTDNITAIRKKGKWKDRQHKPSERRVNGRTDNTKAIRKKGKWLSGGLCCLSFHLPFFLMAIALSVLPFTLLCDGHCKDRQHKPPERRVNGRTDNTMAIKKKSKWKNRQYRLVLSVLPFSLLSGGLCCLFFHLLFFLVAIVLSVLPFTLFLMAIILSVFPFTLLSDGLCCLNGRTDNTSHQKEG
jgi:hypothetical protein